MPEPLLTLRQLLISAPDNASAGGTYVVIDLDTKLDHIFAPWVQTAAIHLNYSYPDDTLTARLEVA